MKRNIGFIFFIGLCVGFLSSVLVFKSSTLKDASGSMSDMQPFQWVVSLTSIVKSNLSDVKGSLEQNILDETVAAPSQFIPDGVTFSTKDSLSESNQKIITYSIYGDDSGYWKGLPEIMKKAKILYPGWNVRVYTNKPNYEVLTNLSQIYSFLQIYDVNNVPLSNASLKEYTSVMWRIYPLGDPQIDVILFRDSDSELLVRERDAVEEWLNKTSKSLHMMRDNPSHGGVEILGGMWGARISSANRKKWVEMRDTMLAKSLVTADTYGIDQTILNAVVWPAFKDDFIAHDSYSCKTHPGSVPFPSQRTEGAFVGSAFFRFNYNLDLKECPEECRPAQHKDWAYC